MAIWLRVTFNSYSNLDKKEELLSELRKICPVQESEEWYAHACTGMEFLVELFINSPLGEFVKGIVIPGLAWDATKLALKKVNSLFASFMEKNEGFDLQRLQLSFDDVTIVVHGIESYAFLLRLYQMFPQHLPVLEKLQVTGISKIELPFVESGDVDKYGNKEYIYPPLDTPEADYLWRIIYHLGLDKCYYKPETKTLE
ncbi:MAG: hypothetical protein IJV36_01375 [Prevotella sp.]|nr:hypothetical protein [Prevotella sp.]